MAGLHRLWVGNRAKQDIVQPSVTHQMPHTHIKYLVTHQNPDLRIPENKRLQHLQQGENILKNQLVVPVPELSWSQVCPAL